MNTTLGIDNENDNIHCDIGRPTDESPNKAQGQAAPYSYERQLCEQRDEARNHADKLAEALRETTDALFNETYHDPRTGKTDSPWIASVKAKATQALAAYEKESK